MSWVKNVARQFGRIFVKCLESNRKLRIVRKEKLGGAAGVGIVSSNDTACVIAKHQLIRVECI